MIKDPSTAWNGPFPYDELAPVGVTPQLTHAAMADVSFDLMTRRMMNSRTQKAWDELRNLQSRLLVDFLLYDVDPVEEVARARADLAGEGTERTRLTGLGELPQIARALSVPAELLDELAGELAEIEVPEPAPVRPDPQFDMFPLSALIDDLIQFDR